MSDLLDAAENGYLEIIRFLIKEEGANVNYRCECGCKGTALHLASAHGHLDTVRLLLDSKANINTKNSWGQTALHKSSTYGYLELTRLLLDKGANIHVRDTYGSTALSKANMYGHSTVVWLLLKHGAKPVDEPLVRIVLATIKKRTLVFSIFSGGVARHLTTYM